MNNKLEHTNKVSKKSGKFSDSYDASSISRAPMFNGACSVPGPATVPSTTLSNLNKSPMFNPFYEELKRLAPERYF